MKQFDRSRSAVELLTVNRESWVRIPFAAVSKIVHFLSLFGAPVHSAMQMSAGLYFVKMNGVHAVIAAWLNTSHRLCWCRNEQSGGEV